jgi:hypothetical protein
MNVVALQALRRWTRRQWAVAVVAAIAAGTLLGLATGSITNPVTTRQIPVPWWGYPLWTMSALLAGMLTATYVAAAPAPGVERKATVGGVLSFFALGCPVCNKLVVLMLGASGALTWFAPLQPILALLSVGLLAEALRRRLRGAAACEIRLTPTRPQPESR